MKDSVVAAAIQFDVKRDPEGNLDRMHQALDKLVVDGPVELVLFPELANSGYVKPRNKDFGRQYMKLAERIPGLFCEGLVFLADKYQCFIISGILEAHPTIPGTIYNAAVLVSPTGVVGLHHKMHLPLEEKHYFYYGNTADVFPTDLGNIAMTVCADASFPETTRIMALKGAEIVGNPVNGGSNKPLDRQAGRVLHYRPSARALENRVYYMSCNRVGYEDDIVYHGGAAIASPSGELIAHTESETEDSIRAELSADVLYEQRALFPYFRDRRPELYGPLAEAY